MGLDISLAYSENWEESLRICRINSELIEWLWANRPEDIAPISPEYGTWAARRTREKAEEVGLPVPVDSTSFDEHISFFMEMPSRLYPDHLFKIGYMRSSYNSSGINHVLDELALPNLYDVFQAGNDYYIEVDWQNAKQRIEELIGNISPLCGKYHYMPTHQLWEDNQKNISAADALRIVQEEFSTSPKPSTFDSYCNSKGSFFLKGIKVVAVVGDWLIYKTSKTDTGLLWYKQALEIVQETIDFILSQPRPEQWRLAWSS